MAAAQWSVSDLFAAVALEAYNALCRRELAAPLAFGCDCLQKQFLGIGERFEQSHVNLLQCAGVAANKMKAGAYIRVSAALVSGGNSKQGAFGFHLFQHACGGVRHEKKGFGLIQALASLIDRRTILFAGGHTFEADNVGCGALELEDQMLAINHQVQRCHAMLVGAQAGATFLAMLSFLESMLRRGMAVALICLMLTIIVVLRVAGESQRAQQSTEQQGSVAHGAFSTILEIMLSYNMSGGGASNRFYRGSLLSIQSLIEFASILNSQRVLTAQHLEYVQQCAVRAAVGIAPVALKQRKQASQSVFVAPLCQIDYG